MTIFNAGLYLYRKHALLEPKTNTQTMVFALNGLNLLQNKNDVYLREANFYLV